MAIDAGRPGTWLLTAAHSTPSALLAALFIFWKTLIVLAALAAPGPAYDSSTSLFFDHFAPESSPGSASLLLQKLVRWDAIYFTATAVRGYAHEQEWAFGWGWSRLVALSATLVSKRYLAVPYAEALTAVLLANCFHLASVFALYHVCRLLLGYEQGDARPVIAAVLHIVAPAGVFLAAPYGESLFSFLSFFGLYWYCKGSANGFELNQRRWSSDASLVAAGAAFGLATTIRSNGLLHGLMFANDLACVLWAQRTQFFTLQTFYLVTPISLAGVLVGVGFALPQYIAFSEYCSSSIDASRRRPWCESPMPSIYSFVQSHYWNVGFLRYWTLSNIPLFLLAGPTLFVLYSSAIWAATQGSGVKIPQKYERRISERLKALLKTVGSSPRPTLQRLALVQLVLALLAFTSFHVQVITRLASGYCLPYLWFAQLLHNAAQVEQGPQLWVKGLIRWSIIYSLVQAGLFGSFLPPA